MSPALRGVGKRCGVGGRRGPVSVTRGDLAPGIRWEVVSLLDGSHESEAHRPKHLCAGMLSFGGCFPILAAGSCLTNCCL